MRQTRRKPQRRINTGPCSFCEAKLQPDYKDAAALRKFVSDRGKIVGRGRSGLCQKHQKRVAAAIKRARHLALMSFVSSR